MIRNGVDTKPHVLAMGICGAIEETAPDGTQIQQLSRSLLQRHASLRLRPVVSSEEIVEAYYRCVVSGYLTRRYSVENTALPACINSSHKAVRRVCVVPGHGHTRIEDRAWADGWVLMQRQNPEVNVTNAERRSARRADLYVVANGQVVSVEFKYVGSTGLGDRSACASQLRRHAAVHAQAILVLYSGGHDGVPQEVVNQLRQLVGATNARIVRVAGPRIPIARGAA